MSVAVSLSAILSITETLETNVAFASATDKSITINGLNQSATLNASSTPPAVLASVYEKALSTGSATIDLTSLPQSGALAGGNADSTSKRLQAVIFKNKTGNTSRITVAKGGSNGYQLAGATWSFPLLPGQWMLFFGNNLADLVAGGAKNIDLTGTGSEVLQIALVFG
jgi:hypothetical protein